MQQGLALANVVRRTVFEASSPRPVEAYYQWPHAMLGGDFLATAVCNNPMPSALSQQSFKEMNKCTQNPGKSVSPPPFVPEKLFCSSFNRKNKIWLIQPVFSNPPPPPLPSDRSPPPPSPPHPSPELQRTAGQSQARGSGEDTQGALKAPNHGA